jgi:uncharacterized protein (TIGR04255 family)
LRRVFYIEQNESYLLQVQPTRFLANWRKQRAGEEYPRFTAAYERFQRGWKYFYSFVEDENLGPLEGNQYELTYINHIWGESGVQFPVDIGKYIPILRWDSDRPESFLSDPLAFTGTLQFSIPGATGRLHVTLKHGVRRSDKVPAVVLEFTARGPASRDFGDMNDWFNAAHVCIVRGFTDLTSAKAHELWGRVV